MMRPNLDNTINELNIKRVDEYLREQRIKGGSLSRTERAVDFTIYNS